MQQFTTSLSWIIVASGLYLPKSSKVFKLSSPHNHLLICVCMQGDFLAVITDPFLLTILPQRFKLAKVRDSCSTVKLRKNLEVKTNELAVIHATPLKFWNSLQF